MRNVVGVGAVGRLTVRVVAALLAVGTVASCAAGPPDGPVVEGSHRGGGEDALIGGSLVLDGDCLYLEDVERYPVIWPNGTGWDPNEVAVVLPNGDLARMGDRVNGGGGFHQGAFTDYTSGAGAALIEACVDNAYGEVAVFNSNSAITVEPG